MYSKTEGHHCWWLNKDGKALANFDNESDVDEIIFLAEKVALISELKQEINFNHNKDSDPMFVSGWKTCAKRVDDFF